MKRHDTGDSTGEPPLIHEHRTPIMPHPPLEAVLRRVSASVMKMPLCVLYRLSFKCMRLTFQTGVP